MKFSVLTDQGFKPFDKVISKGEQHTIRVVLNSGKEIRCTEDHELFDSNYCKIPAQDSLGVFVHTKDGLEEVVEIRQSICEEVYDLTNVEANHRFYANDILVSNCLLDEFAFVKNDEDFYKSTLPVISSGSDSRLTMTSTPNGKKGVFYKTWAKAIKGGSDFFSFGVPWYLVPGRDENWKRKTIEDSSLLDFRIEHNIEFLSGKTNLIETEILEDMELHTVVNPEDEFEGVNIYENPEEGRSYVCTVDTAEGKGQDYSTFTIFDVTEQPYRQVATYRNNDISPLLFAAFIDTWAKHYNEAQLIVENNNASGGIVAVSLRNEYDYDNLYCMNSKDEMGIGIRTTTKVKSIGCSTLRGLLRSKKLTVKDRESYNELCTFESRGTSYEAAEGCNDDLVQNLWIFAWYTTQPEFEEFLQGNSITEDIYGDEIEAIHALNLPGSIEIHPTPNQGSQNDIW